MTERIRAVIGLKDGRSLFWLLQTSGWLLFLALSVLYYLVRGALTTPVFVRYATAMTAGLLTTLLLRFIYKKIRIQDRAILWLSLLTAVLSLIGANLTIWISDALKIPASGIEALKGNFALVPYLRRVLWWLTPFIGWSALYIGIKFWREWTIQKQKAEESEALAQTAQLQMLRYRTNPHFLFNALNSIRALISENRASAKTMITELSEYLRYSLVSKNYENVPLKEEIESVRHYFNIQKMRYEHKLDVAFDLDPEADEYPIISFLLHPLAENAVRYGLSTSPLPLKILIKTKVHQGNSRLRSSTQAPGSHHRMKKRTSLSERDWTMFGGAWLRPIRRTPF